MIKSVVEGTNSELILQAATLWIKPNDLILDMTWGRGLFWNSYKHDPSCFIKHDLYTLDGVDFRSLPEANSSIDVAVFDPAYVAKGGRSSSGIEEMDDRYGLKNCSNTPEALIAYNSLGLAEAYRVLKPKGLLMLKTMDYISSGKYINQRHQMANNALELGFIQVDEFIHSGNTGPQPSKNKDGSLRRQVHSRRSHSFLLIFSK